jgi:hypothetical protein
LLIFILLLLKTVSIMNLMKKLGVKSFTGMRPVKDENPSIQTTPTPGTIRLNQGAAEILGVNYREVLDSKGRDAVGVRIEVGGFEDKILVNLVPEDEDSKTGAKLASPGDSLGGSLQCNSKNTWLELGGDEGHSVVYEINPDNNIAAADEDGNALSLQGAIEAGLVEEGADVTVYYILEKVDTIEKVERKKSSDNDAEDADVDADVEDDEEF